MSWLWLFLPPPFPEWHLPQSRPPQRLTRPRVKRCTRKVPRPQCARLPELPRAAGNSAAAANPKLAAQHPEYVHKQLADFKAKARNNAIMVPMASVLTDEEMRNVGAYLAKQSLKPATAKNKDTIEAGQKIYRGGIAAKGVPACAACHGPTAAGIPAQYPRIGGQWADYTEAQLVAFRQGTRKNNPVMTTIAAKMSDAEIKAVADYVAGVR